MSENQNNTNVETENQAEEKKSKVTVKQVFAILGIVVLAGLYLLTLAAAMMGQGSVTGLFTICVIATFVVPLLIWVMIWGVGAITSKKTIASVNLGGEDHIDDVNAEIEKIKSENEAKKEDVAKDQ
ncbi:MAG: hypothetical protein J6033_07795 [Lachnospiraceae bacterium]|nr:hypothetical protein [Lachnospiraceae bacterium]